MVVKFSGLSPIDVPISPGLSDLDCFASTPQLDIANHTKLSSLILSNTASLEIAWLNNSQFSKNVSKRLAL
jgi:hypothetical protein